MEKNKRKRHGLTEEELIDIDYSFSYSTEFYGQIKRKNLFQIVMFLLNQLIRQSINDLLFIKRYKSIKNKYVLFYESTNQYNALLPLKKYIAGSEFLCIKGHIDNRLPQSIGILLSLFYLPHFLMVQKNSERRELLLSGCYFLIEGMFNWWLFYLKITKPKAIIFANDHLIWQRTLRKVAQFNNIPTIYLQHASVSENFPRLEFDLALLEGNDSLNKYEKHVATRTYLIGMPKYDKYLADTNYRKEIQNIGICTNILDNSNIIKNICYGLSNYYKNETVYLRPHPGDTRKEFHIGLCKEFNLVFSDSNKENSFEYLKKIDLNIACDTSLHLEAVLMNVYPIYYNLNNNIYDSYGYLKNGLVQQSFNNLQDLTNFIDSIKNNKPNIRERAKYYVDTVDTPYDGKSTLKAVTIIEEFVTAYYSKI
ncbi:MAG: hypothetical protein PHE29_10850 [Tissierellia bacterium]|nr:hypothetical protein [Tissierellia bacterium]